MILLTPPYLRRFFRSRYSVYNVLDYGARGDGNVGTFDASVTNGSTTLTSATAGFSSQDVGKAFSVNSGANSRGHLGTFIAYISSTQMTMSSAPAFSESSLGLQWGTDDTAAIQKAIDACYAGGGGTVYFPAGIYQVNGAFQDAATYNGVLRLPEMRIPQTPRAIEFEGASAPPAPSWWISACKPHNAGSIIRTGRRGSGTQPSLIACAQYNSTSNGQAGDYAGMSMLSVSFRNLTLRCHDNPSLAAIQATYGGGLEIDGVVIDVHSVVNAITQPTNTDGAAIRTPVNSNPAKTLIQQLTVQGYYHGLIVNEHTEGQFVNIFNCYRGMTFNYASHASRFGRVLLVWTPYGLYAAGAHETMIDQLDIEHAYGAGKPSNFPSWGTLVSDVYDPNNLLSGRAYIYATKSGPGDVDKMVKTGGQFLQTTDGAFRWAGKNSDDVIGFTHRTATITAGSSTLATFGSFNYYQDAGAQNDQFTQTFTVTDPGAYELVTVGMKSVNQGIVSWSVDSGSAFATEDKYSAPTIDRVRTRAGVVHLKAGSHTLKGTVSSKNGSSSGYAALYNQYALIRIADPVQCLMRHIQARIVSGSGLTNFSGSEYFYQSSAANGDSFEYTFALAQGTYVFSVVGQKSTNVGILDWTLDGVSIVTGQDWYTGSGVLNQRVTATITVTTSGLHVLRGTVNGKHASSSGYAMTLQYFTFASAQTPQ